MFILVIVLKFLCYYLGRCFTVSSAFSFCNQMAGFNLTSLIKSSAVVNALICLSLIQISLSISFIHAKSSSTMTTILRQNAHSIQSYNPTNGLYKIRILYHSLCLFERFNSAFGFLWLVYDNLCASYMFQIENANSNFK